MEQNIKDIYMKISYYETEILYISLYNLIENRKQTYDFKAEISVVLKACGYIMKGIMQILDNDRKFAFEIKKDIVLYGIDLRELVKTFKESINYNMRLVNSSVLIRMWVRRFFKVLNIYMKKNKIID